MKLHILLILNIIFNYFFRNLSLVISLRYFIQKLYHRHILFSIFLQKSNSSPTCRSRRLLAIFLLKIIFLNIFSIFHNFFLQFHIQYYTLQKVFSDFSQFFQESIPLLGESQKFHSLPPIHQCNQVPYYI